MAAMSRPLLSRAVLSLQNAMLSTLQVQAADVANGAYTYR